MAELSPPENWLSLLERMKVKELKEVLKAGMIKTTGRKQELQERIVNMLRDDLGLYPHRTKQAMIAAIRDLNGVGLGGSSSGIRASLVGGRGVGVSGVGSAGGLNNGWTRLAPMGLGSLSAPADSKVSTGARGRDEAEVKQADLLLGMRADVTGASGGGVGVGGRDGDMKCFCGSNQIYGEIVRCTNCSKLQHCRCMGISMGQVPPEYICPACRALRIDPFLVPAEGEAADSLLASALTSRQGVVRFNGSQLAMQWHLPREVYQQLCLDSYRLSDSLFGSAIAAQGGSGTLLLRLSMLLCPPPLSKPRQQRWPTGVQVYLNSALLPIVHHPPAWDGISLKDRNLDEPVELPPRLLRVGLNELRICFSDQQPHAVVLQRLRRRSVDEVRLQVVGEQTLSYEEALTKVLAVAGSFGSDDLIASAKTLTLLCPLTRIRIGTPARAAHCRHLECFDLDAFLQIQKAARVAKWQCPICSVDALPFQLRVCSWTSTVLSSTPTDTREVQVEPDGSTSAVQQFPTPVRTKRIATDLDDDESDVGGLSQTSRGDCAEDPILLD